MKIMKLSISGYGYTNKYQSIHLFNSKLKLELTVACEFDINVMLRMK